MRADDAAAGEIPDAGDDLGTLSAEGRAVLLGVLSQPTVGLSIPDLAVILKSPLEPIAATIADELLPGQWVSVAGKPPRVVVEAWAAEWLGFGQSKDGLRWRRAKPRGPVEIPLNFDPYDPRIDRAARADWARDEIAKERGQKPKDHPETITCIGGGYSHRERHKSSCSCDCCRADPGPTGTKPRPKGNCRSCPPRKLRPNEECLECGRGGQDSKLSPQPLPAEKVPPPPSDAAPKLETRKEKRAKKYGRKQADAGQGDAA